MDTARICLHTATTKPLDLGEALEIYSGAGIQGVTLWRDALRDFGMIAAKAKLASTGLEVVSLCRGGFFPSVNEDQRKKSIIENIDILGEASQIGAPLVVLVPGADPSQSLEKDREQIRVGIEAILPYAAEAGIRLGIEPLHPMYAGDRSAINTLTQANDLCEAIDSPWVGVIIDVYHLWWDPDLESEIHRCGENANIFALHVSDWKVPTIDLLNDRGLMGEGCIPIRQIRRWVEKAGFDGMIEVEIFSNQYWKMDQVEFVSKIVEHFQRYV